MGVTIRRRSDKSDGSWWVFVSHMNRRTSLKVGHYGAALDVQRELQVVLALDRALHGLKWRKARRVSREVLRQGDNLRMRLYRLLGALDELLERNRR